MTILDKIITHKEQEVADQKVDQPIDRVKKIALERVKPRGFAAGLSNKKPAVIAEIKRGSPSRGDIRRSLDPVATAHAFADNGAAALSILTDSEFFLGSLAFVPVVREQLSKKGKEIPILRKDFIIDPYQVWQSRAIGADAILLIVSAVEEEMFNELLAETLSAGLDVLIEVHTETEVEFAVKALRSVFDETADASSCTPLLGINNRNLRNFTTDLQVTERLARTCREALRDAGPALSDILLVSESGISTGEDLDLLASYGATAFLVGESLVATGDPGENLAQLLAGAA